MSQQNIIELARQGNPKAIAALINQNLKPRGVTAKLSIKDHCLRIMLEGNEVPNQASMVGFIQNGITRIGIPEMYTIQLFGRQAGDEVPAWSQTIDLRTGQSLDPPNQEQLPKSSQINKKVVSKNESVFKVKHDGQELIASNIECLREWFYEGRIRLSDYVYNPILDKWMYVRELAEMEDIIKKQESTKQSNQFNKLSFTFAGFGLLFLFIFPPAGIILLIIGVVFSVMYYAKR